MTQRNTILKNPGPMAGRSLSLGESASCPKAFLSGSGKTSEPAFGIFLAF